MYESKFVGLENASFRRSQCVARRVPITNLCKRKARAPRKLPRGCVPRSIILSNWYPCSRKSEESLSTLNDLYSSPGICHLMSSEVFNPNPTIFVSTKTRTATAFSKKNSLWLAEEETSDVDDSELLSDIEDIDQEEIFGNPNQCRLYWCLKLTIP